MAHMKIGQLARASGVKPTTLRFYERRGLLRARRGANGYRMYGDEDAQRVRFVRGALALGFTLGEVKRVLSLSDRAGRTSSASLEAVARAKLVEIHEKREALARLGAGIETLLRRGRVDGEPCPVMMSLDPCVPP